MSTDVKPQRRRKRPPVNVDPYRYGWRYVRQVLPDGDEKSKRVPLSLWDILHPLEGDFRVLSDAHNEDCAYLKSVFKMRRPKATVLADHRIEWDVPGVDPHGPDIMAILKAKPRRGRRPATFRVAEEGARPEMIVEVTSPETRSTDLKIKVDEYYHAGVQVYIIVDELPGGGDARRLRLLGYRRGPHGFEPMIPDERGWLWLEPVAVWIGIKDGRVVCYDERGREIGDYAAIAAALKKEARARKAAEATAAKEAEARKAAEQRIRELEAELRRLRGNGRK